MPSHFNYHHVWRKYHGEFSNMTLVKCGAGRESLWFLFDQLALLSYQHVLQTPGCFVISGSILTYLQHIALSDALKGGYILYIRLLGLDWAVFMIISPGVM